MKNFAKAFVLALSFWCFCMNIVQAQAPVDNPYRTYYPNLNADHWADSIAWGNVVNIQDYRTLLVDTFSSNGLEAKQMWDLALKAAMDEVLRRNVTGVVYFPRLPRRVDANFFGQDSSYYFVDHINLLGGIFLRGPKAHPDSSKATKRNFLPPTYIEFPFYNFSATVADQNYAAIANSLAFKKIRNRDAQVSNIGLIDLDINRGGIEFSSNFTSVIVPFGPDTAVTTWPAETVKNILIMGVRSNNVASPNPNIPRAGQQHYQRWTDRFAANVEIFAKENVSIINCRFNDMDSSATTGLRGIENESFGMPNYTANGFANPLDANQARFNYTDHYGVVVNRLKRRNSSFEPNGFLNNSTPRQEPWLFAKNIEVLDNWIFKTQRVGIHAAGLGLKVKRNIIRDQNNKSTWLTPGGESRQQNTIATYENRGIDFSGWGCEIDSNDIQFYRVEILSLGAGSYSADGEGFYFQGPSGSTAQDFKIRGNKITTSLNGMSNALGSGQGKGFNGLYNCPTITNVVIENNNCGGVPLWLNANSAGSGPGTGILSNVLVSGNTDVRNIQMLGNSGGAPSFIINNTASTPPLTSPTNMRNFLEFSCHVALNPNTGATPNTNTGFNPNNCTPLTNTNPCITPYPQTRLDHPNVVRVPINTTTLDVRSIVPNRSINGNAGCNVDSLMIVRDAKVEGRANQDAIIDSLYTLTINLPIGASTFNLRACVFVSSGPSGTVSNCSSPITIITQSPLGLGDEFAGAGLEIYPNPANDVLNFNYLSRSDKDVNIEITDLTGKMLFNAYYTKDMFRLSESLSLKGLSKGMYLVRFKQGAFSSVKRFVKE